MKKTILSVATVVLLVTLCAGNAHAALTVPAPDAGSTSLLLAPVILGFAAVRRFLRR